jgi:hypothetical protein
LLGGGRGPKIGDEATQIRQVQWTNRLITPFHAIASAITTASTSTSTSATIPAIIRTGHSYSVDDSMIKGRQWPTNGKI